MIEMQDELVEKFVKLNKSNAAKSIFIAFSQKGSSTILQFNSLRKIITQLQEPNEPLHVRSLLYDIIQFKRLEYDFEYMQSENLITIDDPDFLKESINNHLVVVKGINKQIFSELNKQSILKIAELLSWDTSFSDKFSLAVPLKKKVIQELNKTPLRFYPFTNVDVISAAAKLTINTQAVNKNLEEEFNNSVDNKYLYLVTFTKYDEQLGKKRLYLPINPQSISYISKLIGTDVEQSICKRISKIGFDAEKFTETKINEKQKKYNLKLLMSANSHLYKTHNLSLSYDSVKNILKKSNGTLHFKVTQYSIFKKVISYFIKKRFLEVLKCKFNKWRKAETLKYTFKRGKTRVVSSIGNYYISIHKYNNKTINAAFNAFSITKIHNLLSRNANKEDNQIVYKIKHVFWNDFIEKLTNYHKRLFGIYIPQYHNYFQYKIKHLNIKSKTMSKIMRLRDDKITVHYVFHHALKKMITLLMNKFDIIKLRIKFSKWKRKMLKARLLAKARHPKLLTCNIIPSKKTPVGGEINVIKVCNTDDKNYCLKFNELAEDDMNQTIIPKLKTTRFTTLVQAFSQLFKEGSELSKIIVFPDIVVAKSKIEFLKFTEIKKHSNLGREKLISVFKDKNEYNISGLDNITVLGAVSPFNNSLNFTEARKDLLGYNKLTNIELLAMNSNMIDNLPHQIIIISDNINNNKKFISFKEIARERKSKSWLLQCNFVYHPIKFNRKDYEIEELVISKVGQAKINFKDIKKDQHTYLNLLRCNFTLVNKDNHAAEKVAFKFTQSRNPLIGFEETMTDAKEIVTNTAQSEIPERNKSIKTSLIKFTTGLFLSCQENIPYMGAYIINSARTNKLALKFKEVAFDKKLSFSRKRLVETVYTADFKSKISNNKLKSIVIKNKTNKCMSFNESTKDKPIKLARHKKDFRLNKSFSGLTSSLNSEVSTINNIILTLDEDKTGYSNFKEVISDEGVLSSVIDRANTVNTDDDTTVNNTVSHEAGFKHRVTFEKLLYINFNPSMNVNTGCFNKTLKKDSVAMPNITALAVVFKELTFDRNAKDIQKSFGRANHKLVKSGKTKKVHSKMLIRSPTVFHVNACSDLDFNKIIIMNAKTDAMTVKELKKDESCIHVIRRNNEPGENIFTQLKTKLSLNIFKRYTNEFVKFVGLKNQEKGTMGIMDIRLGQALGMLKTICQSNSKFIPLITAYTKKVNPINSLDTCFTNIVDVQKYNLSTNTGIATNRLIMTTTENIKNESILQCFLNTVADTNIGNFSEMKLLQFEQFKLFNSLTSYFKCIEGNLSDAERDEIIKFLTSNLDILKRMFICLKQEFKVEDLKLFMKEVI
jgi:hypothetical protein